MSDWHDVENNLAFPPRENITSNNLTDDWKAETDGILSIATLGTSSVVKGVVKSIKKAGEDLDD